MFFTCGIWHVADVSSVGPLSEFWLYSLPLLSVGLVATSPTGEKHTISTFADQPVYLQWSCVGTQEAKRISQKVLNNLNFYCLKTNSSPVCHSVSLDILNCFRHNFI